MSKKHILVISQYFYPEQFRINDICREWVKRGYRVTVVTGIPNYPQGKFYDGYGILKKNREQYHGVRIIRLPLIPRGKNTIMLALNYLSFVVTGGAFSIFTRIRADYVFIFEVSPMTQALPGVWYARKHRIPCYLYVQDLWPDNVEIITGIHNRQLLGTLDRMVRYIYRRCHRIFVTSESFRSELVRRCVPSEKVLYWPQYAEDFYRPVEKKGVSEKFTIVFTGNIGFAQGLDILPRAAVYLKDENVRFLMVGDGRYKDKLVTEIKNNKVTTLFEFVGRVEPEQVPSYLSMADAAFISFMDSPLFEKTIPAKLQSYMACGMPIIAAATGETKRIIEEAQCGICVPLGAAEELAGMIKRLKDEDLTKMRENSLVYYKTSFDKDMLLNSIDKYFGR